MYKISKVFVGFALFLFFFSSVSLSVTYADIYSGGRSSGVKYAYYDSSVVSFSYNSKFNTARAMWNGITPKVDVGFDPLTSNVNDKYYVGSSSTKGLLGLTRAFRTQNGSTTQVLPNQVWSYATISIYDNNIKTFGLKTDAEIISTVVAHEIGHSLSLDHAPLQVSSIMHSLDQGGYITSFPPTSYDEGELIRKWGR